MTGHVTGDARKRYEVETVDPRAALVEPPAVVRTYVGRDESGLSWMVETMGDVVRIATRRDDWDRWSEPIELVEAHACKHSVRTPDGACVGCGAEVDR